jgi:hypothetical protein
MNCEAQIWQLARTLVGRHGTGATRIAHEAAKQSLEETDYAVASLWCRVAKVVQEMIAKGALGEPDNLDPASNQSAPWSVTQAVFGVTAWRTRSER